jgi:hypothetical protein
MKKLIVFMLIGLCYFSAIAQYKNNKWLFGHTSSHTFPFGGGKIEFVNNTRIVSTDPRNMRFQECFTGLSDKDDSWFVYSNGSAICNKNHDTLVNGGGLSPGGLPNFNGVGYPIPSQALFIPGDSIYEKHYLFHENLTVNSPGHPAGGQPHSLGLFYSIIDPLADNGKGAVISKNNLLINDTIETGNILTVRHANGRDWWVVIKHFYSDMFYGILVTPDSVYAPFTYTVPSPIYYLGGQACFSPNGEHYASFSSHSQLKIYDFDRCSGMLSNYREKVAAYTVCGSVSFSPNSRYLYITSVDSLWQLDMQAPDVLASQTFIAKYDGFVDSITNTGTGFWYQWLAPDGKIYISTANQSLKLHVINNPDLPGQACDFQQHSVNLPTINNWTTPSSINLALYQLPGSPCDTLGVGLRPLQVADYKLQIYPNPNDGRFSVEYTPQRISGVMYVYDVNGREVFREYVSPFTSVKNVDLSGKVNSGVYAVRLVWGNGSGVFGRVVVE